MKIAISQINPVIGDFEHNSSLLRADYKKAVDSGCSLVIFPELSIMGYPPKDLLDKPAFIEDNLKCLSELSGQLKDIYCLCGFVDKNPKDKGKRLINSVALFKDGKILGKGGKRLLPSYDVFDETRYFEPSTESLVFEIEGARIGVTICEDIWNVEEFERLPRYEVDPVSDLFFLGIDILVNISASPYTISKPYLREKVLKTIATDYKVPTIYCNQVGGNDDLVFDGSSMVMDQKGNLIVSANEFESDLIVWESDKEYLEIVDSRPVEEESVLKALTMGTRDYLMKCGFKKALVGLSGGIDSSLVAVIAQRALGPENVMGISMPSPYTSDMSKEDARKLSENLKIYFNEIEISEVFESFNRALSPVFKSLESDVTEENIQARIRGNLLMAMSNKFNFLLLSTGNKSETAAGYCTLYGDMSGGLAVISDIPKTLCYRLARFINEDKEIIPERIITRPPSAELKPDQTDQDTLPSYDLLDELIESIVEKDLSFENLLSRGYNPEIVNDVFRRITHNEYKRRQAPPGLKITSKAFGYGRRYPIARGGKFY